MFILTVNLPLRTTGVLRRHEIAWLAFIASGVAMTSLILDNVDAQFAHVRACLCAFAQCQVVVSREMRAITSVECPGEVSRT